MKSDSDANALPAFDFRSRAARRAARPGGLRLDALLPHAIFVAALLGAWELAAARGWFDPIFFGRPSGVARYLWEHVPTARFWIDLGWTMAAALISFVLGSALAFGVGLAFVAWPALERFAEPYFSALNAMPRIALAPLFILWFGLGPGSKIAVGFSVVFFVVVSSTVAGIRGVNDDHLTLCRTLGARPATVFFRVTLPGAVPVIFSGLRLALVYALLVVIAAEIIASDRGIGQKLAYLGATFNVNGVIALVLVLAALGVAIVRVMTWLERRLLHWQ
ncbi:ABC transporter permease [Ottowia sp.]|uniref:ABC transporter permease n=1 Tax=Ottowia sp. TaxID=1898956 RepID=UPI0025E8C936|nr:ABC transporter permease [Ottowia sp.]MBK6615045.1 ABC transporter permease [Ottowia sp.]MBK6746122.1 ABC transporter permease [Ottowia sp.]